MRKFLLILVCAVGLMACRSEHVTEDPTLRLVFSHDTVCFDTIFTSAGAQEPSATKQVLLYNPNKEALLIERVWQNSGKWFQVNVDGEADLSRFRQVQLNGGDSLFIFIHVGVDIQNQSEAVWVTDSLHVLLANGQAQTLAMEAYGQDVTRVRSLQGRSTYNTYHFTAEKPYLIYDTMVIEGLLSMDAGARLYLHKGSGIYALGDVKAEGTSDEPIVLCGDRIDNLFDSVPYKYAAGGWNGFFLQANKPQNYILRYVDILSGNVGLYCYSDQVTNFPKVQIEGCRIHNHALYGLVLQHVDAMVVNTEISNCASYCVYSQGGTHDFIHSTVASYFGWTNIRIQSTSRDETAAVYINDADSSGTVKTKTSFYNSIITGYHQDELTIAIPMGKEPTYYEGAFAGNYIKTDSLPLAAAVNNTYYQSTDTSAVFRNTFYKYKEYVYYDFRLDSVSPARGIGVPSWAAAYPNDRAGENRTVSPDAGCYQYQP